MQKKLVNMSGMFYGCEKISKLDLSSFNILKKLKFMQHTFGECRNLEKLNLSNWKLPSGVNAYDIFSGCEKLDCLKATDKQLKNIYEEWLANRQNQVYPNINPKNLKINKGKEMQKEEDIDKE